MTTVVVPVGIPQPLPTISINGQGLLIFKLVAGRSVIPPVPLPQTLIGSSTVSSSST